VQWHEGPGARRDGAGGLHRSEAAEFGGAIQAAREYRARKRSAGEAGADAADGEEVAGDSGFGAQPGRRRIRWLDNEGGDLASAHEFSRFHSVDGAGGIHRSEGKNGGRKHEAVVTQATGPGSWSSVLKSVRDMGLGNGGARQCPGGSLRSEGQTPSSRNFTTPAADEAQGEGARGNGPRLRGRAP
jgi:hypothetical protein